MKGIRRGAVLELGPGLDLTLSDQWAFEILPLLHLTNIFQSHLSAEFLSISFGALFSTQ